MRGRLSENARAYLIRETAYLRKLNPAAARNLSRQMRNAQRNLAAFDGMGFERGAADQGMRGFVVGDYLMDYEVVGNEIHVLAIRHGRQLPPDVPLDDDYDFEADWVLSQT